MGVKNLLKIKRWQAGLKQYELATMLKRSAPYLSMVENYRLEPPEDFKRKVAEALKLHVEEIFPTAIHRGDIVPHLNKTNTETRSNGEKRVKREW